MTLPSPLTALLAALGGCTAAAPLPFADAAGPACRLEERNGAYVASLTAAEAMSGQYDLRLAGAGVDLSQSGPFAVRAGQSLELGRATLGRRLPTAALTLQVNGARIACPVVSR
ncbi:curli-like amyloid fiber formation chaperone CsgH [Wenxinia saemankumensis]|uniref:Lipoprotein n=1 Tax=Wenxinia saemankumensis TaxID=1447782 RepID=A0A1M6EU61_9RHOB|nr:curli-like amyloid fiber formation chaperone CsgH [Wenxinia saemankumensis]SHI88962.1 hypothetical protein SAMN05444417_2175 [Wenxinia saemankumensis]